MFTLDTVDQIEARVAEFEGRTCKGARRRFMVLSSFWSPSDEGNSQMIVRLIEVKWSKMNVRRQVEVTSPHFGHEPASVKAK